MSVRNGQRLFGTDGVRGIANKHPITPEGVLKLGKAAAQIFKNVKNGGKRSKILIGKDTRISGYILETALTSGICSMGVDVLLVGPLPTPAIAHLTKSFCADAGIVISASHNPAEHNGIKFFSGDGFKLSDEKELEIENIFHSGNFGSKHINGESIGKAYRKEDAKGRYNDFAKSTIGNANLSGLKVVLDCANGAAYAVAPDIFTELGADVVVLSNRPNGLNINLGCGALHPGAMIEAVKKEGADIGIALDGDADRVIIVDENGEEFDGDFIMALCGLELKKQGKLNEDTIVATTMSNVALDAFCRKNRMNLVRTDVGDRYVIEEVRKNGFNFGGEQSGHIIFMDYITTGDGIITALQVLNIMKKTGKKLSELRLIKKFPQVLINVDVKERRALEQMKTVQKKIGSIKKSLGENGRVLVRYSGTENTARVMIEGKNQDEIQMMAEEIAGEIRKGIGI